MFKAKFKNGTEVTYNEAIETEEFFNGASRRTLTFTCDKNAIGLDELNKIVSNEENTETIILQAYEDSGEKVAENIYEGYALKLSLGVKQQLADVEKNNYVDMLKLKLGKRTYIEEQLHKLGIN